MEPAALGYPTYLVRGRIYTGTPASPCVLLTAQWEVRDIFQQHYSTGVLLMLSADRVIFWGNFVREEEPGIVFGWELEGGFALPSVGSWDHGWSGSGSALSWVVVASWLARSEILRVAQNDKEDGGGFPASFLLAKY